VTAPPTTDTTLAADLLAVVARFNRSANQRVRTRLHRGLGVIALLLAAQPRLGRNGAGAPTRRATPITHPGTGGPTDGFDPHHAATHRAHRLGTPTSARPQRS